MEGEDIENMKEFVNFLFRKKTNKDKAKMTEIIMLKISALSHSSYVGNMYKGEIGHNIRKRYRKDIAEEIKRYLNKRLKEIR